MTRENNILLYPFSLIYGLITGIRNLLYDTGILSSHEFRIPVICVGNITVGGTGKTPHTEYLIELLSDKFKVAVLSRGYKRKSKGFQLATPLSAVDDIGDEPLQISTKYPGIIVAADNDRVRGIRRILSVYPDTDVVILDDGFQHRRITPGFTILLSDYSRPMVKDYLLPYGNLRENLKNLERADVILITKSPENLTPMDMRLTRTEVGKAPYQELFFTYLRYKEPAPLFSDNLIPFSFGEIKNHENISALLVTGIANPNPLKEYLKIHFGRIIHLKYPDHHNFTEKDIHKINEAFSDLEGPSKVILTTEKDSLRLREFTNIAEPLRSSIYYIPMEVQFGGEDEGRFDKMIINYVRENKRNNRISEI